jgi:putative membrane protein
MMTDYGMTGGFGFGGGFMILWLVIIIAALVVLVRWMAMPGNDKGKSDAKGQDSGDGRKAMDILKERYARGEIDAQEFQKKERDLAR